MSYSITALGDAALTLSFGNVISRELNKKVVSLAHAVKTANLPAIKDIVPAYTSVTIHYDLIKIGKEHKSENPFYIMSKQIEALLSHPEEIRDVVCRNLHIPVCYSLKYGLDLPEISEHIKLPVDEIIRLHTAGKYKVYMLGFLPGFAYMGDVDERIAVPRKSEPRLKIEPGSLGIAGTQTGIYPLASPGGWQIIGRTPIKLFDKEILDPVYFRAGDEVEFYTITEDEFDHY